MRVRFLPLLLVCLLVGCAFYGRDFPSTQVKSIQTGVTTENDIFSVFGEPVQRGLESGYETWTYTYQSYSLGEGWKSKTLHVVFNKDKDSTVRDYSFTSN